MDANLRLRPWLPEPDLTSDPDLLALIADEIRRAGPMTFARFMELALYAPELGYYTSPATRIGRGGDFLTAPETHPIFGAAVARQAADVWQRIGRPAQFVIREYGAGSGALAEAILGALATEAPDLAGIVRYEAVEINPHRRADIQSRSGSFRRDGSATKVDAGAINAIDPQAASRSAAVDAGFVLANEYLDAFPVHRVEGSTDGLREVFVDWVDGRLVEQPGPASTPRLAEQLAAENVELEPGQRGEIALGIDDWLADVGRWLRSGAIVIIDYGHDAPDLYGRHRRAGTLLGYVDHRVVDDPLVAIGRQDLTAHIDFTAVERAAAGAGFDNLGLTTQARFLMNLGLEDLLERARSNPDQTLGQYVELRSGVVRLLDPRHTGGFRVLAFGRGLAPAVPLLGLRGL
jgi:SAM-dependent MidA family methyltransferase